MLRAPPAYFTSASRVRLLGSALREPLPDEQKALEVGARALELRKRLLGRRRVGALDRSKHGRGTPVDAGETAFSVHEGRGGGRRGLLRKSSGLFPGVE